MAELTHGMNLAQVEELGTFLHARADDLQRLVTQVDARVRTTTWHGPDADRFRHQFWPQRRSQLLQASERVRGLGTSARHNAAEQRVTSEAAGSGSTGGWKAEDIGDRLTGVGEWLGVIDDFLHLGGDLAQVRNLMQAGKGLGAKVPYLSLAFGGADLAWQTQRHGWGSAESIWSTINGVGGGAAAAFPLGGLAWWGATTATKPVAEWALDHIDGGWEASTGSTIGYSNSVWMLRHYGVAEPSLLEGDVRARATSELVDHTTGWHGLWNTTVADPISNTWWSIQ